MRWLALSLAGPGIWAAGFSLTYALHGTGCAAGWPQIPAVAGLDLHRAALWSGWLATLVPGVALLLWLPPAQPDSLTRWLPRAGAWIGLVATLLTLLPVAVVRSC